MSDLSHLPVYRFDVDQLQAALSAILVGADPTGAQPDRAPDDGLLPGRGPHVQPVRPRPPGRGPGAPRLPRARGRGSGPPPSWAARCATASPCATRSSGSGPTEQVPAALDRVDDKCRQGFDIIRFYAGTDHAADVAFISGFADRFGGRVRIKSLDFSNQLGWREALQATERLTSIADVMLVESPALRGDLEGLVEFRRRSRHPVSEHVHGHAPRVAAPAPGGGRHPQPVAVRAGRHPADHPGRGHGRGSRGERPPGHDPGAGAGHGRRRPRRRGAARAAVPGRQRRPAPVHRRRGVAAGRVRGRAPPCPDRARARPDRSTAAQLERLRSNGDWSFGLDLAGAVDRTPPS